MSRAAALATSFAILLEGCAVSGAGISPSDVAVNQCTRDTDCGSSSRCVQNLCQGTGGSLTALLVAVTPPPTLVGINSFTYFTDFTKELAPGSGGGTLDIPLDSAVSMTGTVRIDTTACKAKAPNPTGGPPPEPLWKRGEGESIETTATGAIPVNVIFTPREGSYAVPVDSFSAGPNARGWQFDLTVPPDEYDLYVKPAYPLGADWANIPECQVPPLVLHQVVAKSMFDFSLPTPSKLDVTVTWPLATGPAGYQPGSEQTDPFLSDPLRGWTLDLVDPSSGRVISTSQPLSPFLVPPAQGATTVSYVINDDNALVYSHVSVAVNSTSDPNTSVAEPLNVGTEILRLTPPEFDPRFSDTNVPFTAPTFLVQLDGALVDADGKPAPAHIVQDVPLPTPVTVQFQTALHSDGTPIAAGVLITAEELDGITGLSSSLTRSIQVGTDGLASVDLLPGRYRVLASPKGGGCTPDGCLALTQTEWDVGATPPWQGGKTIEFVIADAVTGSAFVNGRPAAGATVHAVSSLLNRDTNVLNVGDAMTAVVPRASSGLVESDGAFSFEADRGVFDLRIEPDPSTGYGWFVRPGLDLTMPGTTLDALDLDLPIVYSGTVTGSVNGQTQPIPKALIRAYAYIDAKGAVPSKLSDAAFAIQVAETYSEDSSGTPGSFKLLLPKQLQKP